MSRQRILVLWQPGPMNDAGTHAIVELLVVPAHADPKDWFAWLDGARATAESVGLSLYNWGDVEPVSLDQALERITSRSRREP